MNNSLTFRLRPELVRSNEILDAEIRFALTEENGEFLQRFSGLIPEVFARFRMSVAQTSPVRIAQIYAELVHELALSFEKYGTYRDVDVAVVCLRLRLQRRFLSAIKPARPIRQWMRVA
ncbi:MAG: hypothetical protein ACQKBV_09415 [Puniceicoccales bacterium]